MSEDAIPTVVIGVEGHLLGDAFATQLAARPELKLADERPHTPARFRNTVRGLPTTHVVGLLLDPVGTEWGEVAESLRKENERVGVVVVTARPDYSKQRYWRHPIAPDLPRANALLSFGSTTADLIEAIEQTSRRPGQASQFWLDGPRHPFAHAQTDEGAVAQEVRERSKGGLHRTLALLALGKHPRVVARQLDIKREQVGERQSKLRELVQAQNDVQLGHLATRLGLLDDLGDLDVG